MVFVAFCLYFFIGFFVFDIVLYVLGESWIDSIETIEMLLVIMLFQIIGSPLSGILLIYSYQKIDFLIQLIMFSLFLVVFFLEFSYFDYLKYYSFFMSLVYIFFIVFVSWLVLYKKINY